MGYKYKFIIIQYMQKLVTQPAMDTHPLLINNHSLWSKTPYNGSNRKKMRQKDESLCVFVSRWMRVAEHMKWQLSHADPVAPSGHLLSQRRVQALEQKDREMRETVCSRANIDVCGGAAEYRHDTMCFSSIFHTMFFQTQCVSSITISCLVDIWWWEKMRVSLWKKWFCFCF